MMSAFDEEQLVLYNLFLAVKKFLNKNQGDQDGVRCGARPHQGGRQHPRHPHLAGDFRATWHDVAD